MTSEVILIAVMAYLYKTIFINYGS